MDNLEILLRSVFLLPSLFLPPSFSLFPSLPPYFPPLPPQQHPEDNLDDSMVDEHYPLVADATFVPTLHSEVLKESDWACPSLHAAIKFAWAVLLRECASRVTFSGVCVLGGGGGGGYVGECGYVGRYGWVYGCVGEGVGGMHLCIYVCMAVCGCVCVWVGVCSV